MGAVPMVTMHGSKRRELAQSAANWRNTHTRVDSTHSLTHLHQRSYNHVVRSARSAFTEFRIEFLV